MKKLSYLLKFGFYLSMLLLSIGLFDKRLRVIGFDFSYFGILFLLILPLVFIFALGLFFLYKKDFKKSAIAFVLLMVLVGNIFL